MIVHTIPAAPSPIPSSTEKIVTESPMHTSDTTTTPFTPSLISHLKPHRLQLAMTCHIHPIDYEDNTERVTPDLTSHHHVRNRWIGGKLIPLTPWGMHKFWFFACSYIHCTKKLIEWMNGAWLIPTGAYLNATQSSQTVHEHFHTTPTHTWRCWVILGEKHEKRFM